MTAKSTPDIERVKAGLKGCVTRVENEYKRKILGIFLVAVFGIVGIIVGFYLENIIGFPTIYTGAVCGAIGGICGLLLG